MRCTLPTWRPPDSHDRRVSWVLEAEDACVRDGMVKANPLSDHQLPHLRPCEPVGGALEGDSHAAATRLEHLYHVPQPNQLQENKVT